jgi:hypothetical protein
MDTMTLAALRRLRREQFMTTRKQITSKPIKNPLTLSGIRRKLEDFNRGKKGEKRLRAALLIPILPGNGEPELLFEVRSPRLRRQPGEVCFPGGIVEPQECSEAAAIREAEEELLISRDQLEMLSDLGEIFEPTGLPVRVFSAVLHRYRNTASADEVWHCFSVPVRWFLEHPPTVYHGSLIGVPGEDFPFDRIPGGRQYPFATRSYDIPFYLETEPLIWGLTARAVLRFCHALS